MEPVTKDDLRQMRLQLLLDIEAILNRYKSVDSVKEEQEWLRSKSVRRMMDISAATLQNIRVSGKIRFRKIMGSYYYNRTDLINLFGDGSRQ